MLKLFLIILLLWPSAVYAADAILHAQTRVVLRSTTDLNHRIHTDEVKQTITQPIPADFGKVRYKMMPNGFFVPATQAEVDTANLLPLTPTQAEIVAAIDEALAEPTVTPGVKRFLQSLRVIYSRRGSRN